MSPSSDNHDQQTPDLDGDGPWTAPSVWYRYRCPSCDYAEWVEDIVIDGFPPQPDGSPTLLHCRECGALMSTDPSEPTIKSLTDPNRAP